MIKKRSLLSLAFPLMILSALLLQSLHSYHHLDQFLTEKHCHHQYTQNKTEINHQHHDFDHCFVCELALSHYTPAPYFSFDFHQKEVAPLYTFCYSKQITQSFRGSLFALRAPPVIIA